MEIDHGGTEDAEKREEEGRMSNVERSPKLE
jgi:hypothetical protein